VTLLAVIVAVAYPSLRERPKLQLRLRLGREILTGIPPTSQLLTTIDPNNPRLRNLAGTLWVVLTITNSGRPTIIVDGWEMRFEGQGETRSFVKPERGTMPIELTHGNYTQLISSEILAQMPALTEMWITDTIGRKWRVSRSEIRKIRAFKSDLI
jgi:hypothetical protein